MSDIFDIKRFGLVLKKDIRENGKRYLLSSLTLFAIMMVALFYQSYSSYFRINNGGVTPSFEFTSKLLLNIAIVLILCFGLVFASTFMTPMQNKTSRISYLSYPASIFEKFASRWMIVVLGYLVVFFLSLWLVDLIRVAVFSMIYPKIDVSMIDFSRLVNWSNNVDNVGSYSSSYVFDSGHIFMLLVGVFFLLQSVFILGSTFWEKAIFVKTTVALAIIIFLYVIISRTVILLFFDSIDDFFVGINILFHEVSDRGMAVMITTGFAVFVLLNWIIAFLRVREAEIIKRI